MTATNSTKPNEKTSRSVTASPCRILPGTDKRWIVSVAMIPEGMDIEGLHPRPHAVHAAVCCRPSFADRPTDRSASRRIDKPSSTSASVETIGGTSRMTLVRPSLPRA
jgi:hypothetical protein